MKDKQVIVDSSLEEQTEEVKEKTEVELLQDSVNELNDKYVRLYADKENMQKRYSTLLANSTKYRDENLAKDILPVIDDLERCISAMAETESEGIKLIYNKLLNILKQHNIEQIKPEAGLEFTTDTMEAITTIPSEENKGKVIDCTQNGYRFPERVIRYAKVVVGQ